MEINKELVRYVLLIGALPIAIPFVRILWRDFNAALREEGGLFGRPLSPREVERLRAQKASETDPLVSEPWVDPNAVRKPHLAPKRGAKAAPSGPPRPTFRRRT